MIAYILIMVIVLLIVLFVMSAQTDKIEQCEEELDAQEHYIRILLQEIRELREGKLREGVK